MRAVLVPAYVVLCIAIASKGPAHAQENSAKLAAVEAAVNQNADTLASLTETLKTMKAMLHLVAYQNLSDSCEYNDLLYPKDSTADTVCGEQTCRNGEWKVHPWHLDSESSGSCCEYYDNLYPEGSTLEDESCPIICKEKTWILDNSSSCCHFKKDRHALRNWFSSGKSLKLEFGFNITCNFGQWNGFYYSPVQDIAFAPQPLSIKNVKKIIRYNPEIRHNNETDWEGTNLTDINWDGMNYWIDQLNMFINNYEPYMDSPSDIVECPADGEICPFYSTWLGDKCTKAEDWGYSGRSGSSPCVILKMQRVKGWTPDVYQSIAELPADMPRDLKKHIKMKTRENGGNVPKMVWLHCKCENPAHEEYIHDIEYTPWQGFPANYFPYLDTDYAYQFYYMDPIVAVRFDAPPNNIPINIECKVYAKNIVHNSKQQFGVINIELTKLG